MPMVASDRAAEAVRFRVRASEMNEASRTRGAEPPPKTHAHAAARWCIRPLVDTPITPNHLTTLRLLTGIAAAAAFSVGPYLWTACGGVLFVVSGLLDRADGELARLSKRMSSGGHWYDLYCDMAVNVLVFVGIGFGLADRIPGIWAPVMGIVSGLSVGAIFLVVFQLHDRGSHPGIAFSYPKGFDLDDTLFIVAIFAWLDALLPLLIAAAVGAPLFLVFALYRYRRLRTGP